MGQPIGMNLLKAGHSLTGWNRTISRANELVAMGATLAASPREVAAAADGWITVVRDPAALESVLWGAAGHASVHSAGLSPRSTQRREFGGSDAIGHGELWRAGCKGAEPVER